MKTTSLPRKFLSRRENKNGHHRGRSSDPAHKVRWHRIYQLCIPISANYYLTLPQHRPMSADAFFSIFKPDSARHSTSTDTEQEKEAAKVRQHAINLNLGTLKKRPDR